MAAAAGANISNMKSNLIKPSPSLPLLLAKQSPPISSSQQLNVGQSGHCSYQMGDTGTRKIKENPRYGMKGNFGGVNYLKFSANKVVKKLLKRETKYQPKGMV